MSRFKHRDATVLRKSRKHPARLHLPALTWVVLRLESCIQSGTQVLSERWGETGLAGTASSHSAAKAREGVWKQAGTQLSASHGGMLLASVNSVYD